jgi:hypothetical protein
MKRATPLLKQFAGLWTLSDQKSNGRPWTLEEKFRAVKKAGFDAIGGGATPEVVPLCEKFGLDYVCYIDPGAKTCADRLEAARAARPVRINTQLCDHDTPPREAVRVWLKLEALAKKMGLAVDLEVHRDTCTETPEKVAEIAALYRQATGANLRLCFDYSHFAVVKHLNPPYAARLLTHPDLVRLSRQVHFRPFNGHHCQIPVTDGKGHDAPDLKPYLDFVDAFFACWFAGAKAGDVLYACPENGPVSSGYGLACFPDVWKDAIVLRERIEKLWAKHLRRWKKYRAFATE